MLNLLKLLEVADYSGFPTTLQPASEMTGKQAYMRYVEHTLPYLQASGGRLLYLGEGGAYLIGPAQQGWELVMLVQQTSLQAFLEFASDEGHLAGIGHRSAAVIDSRILPLEAMDWH
jgi:uncharacterized protein (DUF1330 family)